MSEDPVKKQLNYAKKTACSILAKAGYKTERASNDIYCVVAMRDTEWRVIKIGVKAIISCKWFLEEIRRLENLPCPDMARIKKEIWIREDGAHDFSQYCWKNGEWYSIDDQQVKFG